MKHLGLTILIWLLMTTVGLTNPVVLRLQGLYSSLKEGEVLQIRTGTRCPEYARISLDYPVRIVAMIERDNDLVEESISLSHYYPEWHQGQELWIISAYPLRFPAHRCNEVWDQQVKGHWILSPGSQATEDNYVAW